MEINKSYLGLLVQEINNSNPGCLYSKIVLPFNAEDSEREYFQSYRIIVHAAFPDFRVVDNNLYIYKITLDFGKHKKLDIDPPHNMIQEIQNHDGVVMDMTAAVLDALGDF